MSDEPVAKPRKARRAHVQWPVRALVYFPGTKAPRTIEGTQVIRESARYIFIVPDQQRPYIQKTVIVYDCPGLVIELEQMAAPPVYQPQQPSLEAAPQGQGDVLRLAPSPQTSGPLRARVQAGAPPVSEARDEAGNRVLLPGAFGLSVG